jgi:hypothetical protein
MKKLVIPGLFLALLLSCGQKDKSSSGDESFFPVLSFIQSQVAHVDTSLYQIIQLNIIDSTRTDTIYISREQFRGAAKDFLELPDLAEKKYAKRYKEEKIYDETMNRAVFIYKPNDPKNEVVLRQELVVTPDPYGGNGKVNNIIIDFVAGNRDSLVEKKMLWQADKSFQVTTIRQKPGQPETISTTKVIWNESEEQQ